MRGQHSHEVLVAIVAAFFLVAHLWSPQDSLEDIDSINFALGVQSYDVARHQPHPPGYPVYIAGARAATALVRSVRASAPPIDALGLVLLAGVSGAIAVVAGRWVLAAAHVSPWVATTAALLFACAPLTWLTAARPLSDMPGLAAGLIGQLLLLKVATPFPQHRLALAAAAGAWTGLAIGVRSQVLWLTLPLASVVVVRHLRARLPRTALVLVVGVTAGMLTWAVPMLLDTGGIDRSLAALEDQADDDFGGVPMLALQPGLARARVALADTLVQPWAGASVAAPILLAAVVGTVAVATGAPHVLATMAWLWVPYAAFHMLFQETETTRYALPLVLPLCALVAASLDLAVRRRHGPTASVLAAMLLMALLGVSLRAHWQYRSTTVGVFDALRSLRDEVATDPPDAVLMHRRVWAETRRAREVLPLGSADLAAPPHAREWMAARPLLERERVHAWWLVDPRRGDLVAIDPRALTLRARYRWPAPASSLLGGMRPHAFDWYTIDGPSWVLDDGWALTPELAGLSHAAGAGPSSSTGSRALVRATGAARTLLIGGRHLGSDGAATLEVSVGGAWQADHIIAPGAFHRVWRLPPATSEVSATNFAETLTVRTDRDVPSHAIVLEQFDIQPEGVPVVALGDGWFEPERDVVSGRQWRWMADRGQMEIWGADCDVRLTISGTWPRHYAEPPTLTVRASTTGSLFSAAVSRPFTVTIDVPRQATQDGRMALELSGSQSFLAGVQTGTADARRLSLEITNVSVVPATGGRSCVARR